MLAYLLQNISEWFFYVLSSRWQYSYCQQLVLRAAVISDYVHLNYLSLWE